MHDIWVLGYGDIGSEWEPNMMAKFDLRKATYRNTFTVFPDSWTVVRVKFDNAGVALFRKLTFDRNFVVAGSIDREERLTEWTIFLFLSLIIRLSLLTGLVTDYPDCHIDP